MSYEVGFGLILLPFFLFPTVRNRSLEHFSKLQNSGHVTYLGRHNRSHDHILATKNGGKLVAYLQQQPAKITPFGAILDCQYGDTPSPHNILGLTIIRVTRMHSEFYIFKKLEQLKK